MILIMVGCLCISAASTISTLVAHHWSREVIIMSGGFQLTDRLPPISLPTLRLAVELSSGCVTVTYRYDFPFISPSRENF